MHSSVSHRIPGQVSYRMIRSNCQRIFLQNSDGSDSASRQYSDFRILSARLLKVEIPVAPFFSSNAIIEGSLSRFLMPHLLSGRSPSPVIITAPPLDDVMRGAPSLYQV